MKHDTRLLFPLILSAAACVVGAPHGFSKGTNWNIPVVGALEDGPLITPVTINGQGPYLFYVNPHSASIVDPRVAKTTNMYTVRSTNSKLTGGNDTVTHEKVDYAEALSITIGDLTVEKRVFIVLPNDSTYHGQPVLGTIGAEFFSETLIWTIDRDRQMVYLATQGHQAPPANAMKLGADRIAGRHFFIEPKINGKRTYAYMDLGQPSSALRPEIISKTRMEPMAGVQATDFFGRRYSYSGGFNAAELQLGQASTRNLVFAQFVDKRWRKQELDGYIGRDFFSRFRVMVNWHKKTVWLEARADDINEYLADRLARWGNRFQGCDDPACVKVAVNTDEAGQATLRFDRARAASGVTYEVLLEAVGDDERPLGLPRLLVAFPAGATVASVDGADAQQYARASGIRVIDVSPYAPECNTPSAERGCVWTLQP